MHLVIIAGLLAAGFAFVGNQKILQQFGSRGISTVTPLFEETLKTGLALLLSASILGVHLVFGIVEGIYDYGTASKGQGWAAAVSVISHGIFGLVTMLVISKTGYFLAIVLSATLHTSWNYLIVAIAEKRQRRKLY